LRDDAAEELHVTRSSARAFASRPKPVLKRTARHALTSTPNAVARGIPVACVLRFEARAHHSIVGDMPAQLVEIQSSDDSCQHSVRARRVNAIAPGVSELKSPQESPRLRESRPLRSAPPSSCDGVSVAPATAALVPGQPQGQWRSRCRSRAR
jgi:hypothetical protein